MIIEKVKKRSGDIVDFDRAKIENAIEKACLATSTPVGKEVIIDITDTVVNNLAATFIGKIPGVEDVQDMVEKKIAGIGLFEVAKAYILYRKEHEKLREEKKQEILSRIARSDLKVKKRDGQIVVFNIAEIEKAIINCCQGFENVDTQGIIDAAKLNIYDGISTHDINQAVILALKARIELDPVYSQIASRFLINDLYKDVLGMDEFNPDFKQIHKAKFAEKMKEGIDSGRLHTKLAEFDFEKLASALKPERDSLFAYMGVQTLNDRYFLRGLDQKIIETPQYFWMRVAMGLAQAEMVDREAVAIQFYDTLSRMLYVSSTPTLLHSGTHHPQMSSCYLTTVEDDLGHIFKCMGDNAQLSKWSGGLGCDWTNIRGTNSLIKSINVGSQGVIPFLKIVDATTASINRSGKRRGAACVYLETWHYDIEEFLDLRKNTGDDRRRTHDINTANWIPDLFMKRVLSDGQWTLFSPDETPELHHVYGREFERKYEAYERKAETGEIKLFKKMRAVDLWRKMITMLFETGHPWMTFKDACNIRSPQDHVGVIHSSNLCTEITLNTSAEETAVCNLGSVNLIRHITPSGLDYNLLQQTVRTAVRMLDNVIDINFYPTKEAETSNLRHRPIGLGIMGFQDILYKLDLNFDSDEAIALSDKIMEYISYYAILASSEMAKEKGKYSSYEGSKWDRGFFPIDTLKMLESERGVETGVEMTSNMDWEAVREHVRRFGMRNSNCLAIAPTATIANISGCLPSIEPIYKNIYVKSNFSGDFTVVNQYLVEDLRKLNIWNESILEKLKYYDGSVQKITEIPANIRAKYKETFEIDPHWIVRHAAYRGKWIDQSQSVNIFSSSNSGRFISDIYLNAWRMGMKTTYYLRTLGASAIEKSTLDINKKFDSPEIVVAQPISIPLDSPNPLMMSPSNPEIYVAADAICESCQ
jgi:ribonucleoside-diphosphate reductase alpha chain